MRKIKKGFQLAFIFTVMILICFSATAAEIETVTNNSDSGAGSLRQAIADVDDGGTINFDNALSGDVITLSSEISINKSLTIQGLGADKLSVSGNNSCRIFYIENNSNVNISDLSIVDGNRMGTRVRNGGGISLYNNCNLSLLNVNFKNCTAQLGGAIVCSNGTSINIQGCEFINNFTQDYSSDVTDPKGGAIYIGSNPTSTSTLSVKDSIFSENKSLNGGAIYTTNYVGTTIDNCTFTNNQSTATGGSEGGFPGGGAIYASGTGTTLKIENSSFFKNRNNNTYNRNGGAMYVSNLASLVIDSCLFSENGLEGSSHNGGAVFIDKSPTQIYSSMFSNNTAKMFGGAVFIDGSPVKITSTTFNQNSSTRGGGISKTGFLSDSNTLTMINCTLAGNTAEIWNSDGNQGGGIFYNSHGGLDLSFCTISGNVANTSGNGIYTVQKNYLEIKNCIIAANTGSASQIADSTGGTTNYTKNFSIVSDDIASNDLFGDGLAANDGPLVGSTVSADQVPLLTLALKPDSPAIDSAASTDIDGKVVSEDQRGVSRPQGLGYDIGAYEFIYDPVYHHISTVPSPGGYFDPVSADVLTGTDETFTVTPYPGFLIEELFVDEQEILDFTPEGYTYTFENVSSDLELRANFMIDPAMMKETGVEDLDVNDTTKGPQSLTDPEGITKNAVRSISFNPVSSADIGGDLSDTDFATGLSFEIGFVSPDIGTAVTQLDLVMEVSRDLLGQETCEAIDGGDDLSSAFFENVSIYKIVSPDAYDLYEVASADFEATDFFTVSEDQNNYYVSMIIVIADDAAPEGEDPLQALEEMNDSSYFFVYDGAKDGKFTDPIVALRKSAGPVDPVDPVDPGNNDGGTCSLGTFTPLAALLLLPMLLMFKK